MKNFLTGLFLLLLFAGCKKDVARPAAVQREIKNEVEYASGFSITRHGGFSIVKVTDPWPDATKNYTYVLKQKNAVLPDSLKTFPVITVPVKRIIVTSTTHIPSLEMLGVENSLVGFPNLGYISSEKIGAAITAGKIRDLGSNQSLNVEVALDLEPDVIIGYGIDNINPALDNLEKSGLRIILDGDWNEREPLGKAEWIKLFGALYGKERQADSIFDAITSDYKNAISTAKKAAKSPTVLMGGLFENKWNLPGGQSWAARFINDANGNYPWKSSEGSGSLSLPFESVLETAGTADVWIGPGQFSTLAQMLESNPHYAQFRAFKNKNVYTFKVGKTGGVIYYELAPNRPDLVLKDVIKMLHPELLPGYDLFFFEKMK